MNHNPRSLPRWAQDEIKRLKAEVVEWRKLATLADRVADTNVVLVDCGEERALPRNAIVRFKLGPKMEDEIEVHFAGRQDPNGVLVVRTRDSGIVVYPSVANVIHVKPGRAP